MKKDKFILVYVAIGLVAVLILAWGLISAGKMAAMVNSEKISQADFTKRLEAKAGLTTLSQMIGEVLLKQEAERQGVVISDAIVDDQMAKTKEQFGTSFSYILSEYNMSEQDLWESMKMNMIVYELATKDMVIEDSEVEKYFKDNKADFDEPELYRANQIIVADETTAKDLVQQIKDGADFAELAKSHSLDVATRESGGDLGFFARGTMPEEFDTAVFAKKPGDLVGPFKTEYGYHIVQIVDKKAPVPADLKTVWDEVVKAVKAEKAPTAEEMIASLMQSAKIAVVNPAYKDLEANLLY